MIHLRKICTVVIAYQSLCLEKYILCLITVVIDRF